MNSVYLQHNQASFASDFNDNMAGMTAQCTILYWPPLHLPNLSHLNNHRYNMSRQVDYQRYSTHYVHDTEIMQVTPLRTLASSP